MNISKNCPICNIAFLGVSYRMKKRVTCSMKCLKEYFKGKHHSSETEFKKGNKSWNEGTKGVMNAWNKGLHKEEYLKHFKNGKFPLKDRKANDEERKKNSERMKKWHASNPINFYSPFCDPERMNIIAKNTKERMIKTGGPNKGKHTWNAGLTKETNEIIRNSSIKTSKTIKKLYDQKLIKDHKGWHHSEKNKIIIGIASLNQKNFFKNTSIEVKLQQELEKRNIQFETHKNIENVCCPDISLQKEKIVIQADGDYWHKYPHGTEKDHHQDAKLREKGWIVIRFWEHEINKDPMACIDFVQNMMNVGTIEGWEDN